MHGGCGCGTAAARAVQRTSSYTVGVTPLGIEEGKCSARCSWQPPPVSCNFRSKTAVSLSDMIRCLDASAGRRYRVLTSCCWIAVSHACVMKDYRAEPGAAASRCKLVKGPETMPIENDVLPGIGSTATIGAHGGIIAVLGAARCLRAARRQRGQQG